jgi:uncharacterized Ntn-hydrolase superfamily protein
MSPARSKTPGLVLSTFSITAQDERTGMLGVAVSTAVPAVGALCPFAKPGVGAIASQAFVNYAFGAAGLRLLEEGATAPEAVEQLIDDDPGRGLRQLSIVDAQGRAASYTGSECTSWAGHRLGTGVAVAGNMLVGEETVAAMLNAYEQFEGDDFLERLMQALEAGQAAGGDFRGRQSAALKVVHTDEIAYCDLRVDEHPTPVAELRRVLEVARVQLLPFVHALPNKDDPLGTRAAAIREQLRRPPAERSRPA